MGLSGPSGGVVSADLTVLAGNATEGVDFDVISGPIFGVGSTVANATIRVYADGAVEGVENVVLGFTNVTSGVTIGAPATVDVTILDAGVAASPPPPPPSLPSPPPPPPSPVGAVTISFPAGEETVSEPGAGFVDYVVPVTLSGPSGGVVSADLTVLAGNATEGVDFDVISGPIFGIGSTVANATIRVYSDGAVEGVENVVLGFTNVTSGVTIGAPATVDVTILDAGVAASPPPPPPSLPSPC